MFTSTYKKEQKKKPNTYLHSHYPKISVYMQDFFIYLFFKLAIDIFPIARQVSISVYFLFYCNLPQSMLTASRRQYNLF